MKFLFYFLIVASVFSCQQNSNMNDNKSLKPMSKNASVKIKVLGTAQDGGLPQTGCSKAHCLAAWQDSRYMRLVTSLAIFDLNQQSVFLVDATPDIRTQIHLIQTDPDLKLRKSANPVDGILLTHAHMGHYTGLAHFGFEAISTKELPVFCTQRMADFLIANGPWNQLINFRNITVQPFQYDEKIQITPQVTISALPVPHRDEYTDTIGFIINGPNKSMLYVPDIDQWHTWDRSLEEVIKDVDYAILDGTFYSADELPHRDISKVKHPLITQTVELLQEYVKTNAVKIYFTHLNHTNLVLNKKGENRSFIESKGFFIAEEGMEFAL